jgi:hypothetical protein
VPVIVLSSAVDLAMGQWPFQWVLTNLQLNLIEGRSKIFGVFGPLFFLTEIWGQWGWLTIAIAILAIESGPQYRPLIYAAVFNLAAHSLVGHKEYRFIELTTVSLALLAAIGSVNAVQWLERRSGKTSVTTVTLAGLLAVWAGASAWLGRDRPLDQWFGKRSVGPELVLTAGRDPRVCGLGVIMGEYWQVSRSYLGRPMPIILLDSTPRPFPRLKPPGPETASVNAILAPDGSKAVLPAYREVKCKGDEPYRWCLYVRSGSCRPTPEARDRELQRVLAKYDM